ncbi:DUF3265 domain-containing protein [Vibrio vulnificus]|nr:DUF3265 domain-containing protein [Vibrio vulnificus]
MIQRTSLARKLTNCLRVIRNAWHFFFLRYCVAHTLTGRYASGE